MWSAWYILPIGGYWYSKCLFEQAIDADLNWRGLYFLPWYSPNINEPCEFFSMYQVLNCTFRGYLCLHLLLPSQKPSFCLNIIKLHSSFLFIFFKILPSFRNHMANYKNIFCLISNLMNNEEKENKKGKERSRGE